ncbi:MAG: TIGR04053 family radical SAM/SPASM domain-containing protein [Pirellulales bacterium]|nr:TIGR04053 family radical SAM/SPASM domain-containing protein [Pirellulales bacterium]
MKMPEKTAAPMRHGDYRQEDFGRNPLMFYYEVTLACDLVCKHCRASAQEQPHPEELATEQSKALIDQVATFPRRPMMVMTGGDPLKRADLCALIRHAVGRGLQVALTPSATPLATREAFERVRQAGIRRLGISLDGADEEVHDGLRGLEGSFQRTLKMLDDAKDLQMAVQVNTSITQRNVHQLDAIAELLAGRQIAMWSVFLLVPVGRGLEEQRIEPEQYEQVFERLWHHAQTKPYGVKTTEAPHYRRFVLQRGGDPLAGPRGEADSAERRGHRAPLGVGDGKGVMFVNHMGEIYPAGFLPLRCGRFPEDSVVEVYQNHPTFRALRDPDGFKGRCGACEYRHVCGGSRARAYAVTGDPLETEPDCVYVPGQDRRGEDQAPTGR